MINIVFLAFLIAVPTNPYAGMDMAVAEKWGKAKVVRYRVEGLHKARTGVVAKDFGTRGLVVDRLTVEFTWDVRKSRVVGPVTVVDGKSEVSDLKSEGTNCGPPQLKGEYEHFQSVSTSMVSADLIEIKGTRTYPPANISNYPASCSMRPVPGAKVDVVVHLGGAAPEALGMPINPGAAFSASADRKSFTARGAENWVWTFTPTLVQ